MKKYTKIRLAQPWSAVGREINGQLRTYPETNEIMYVQVERTKQLYDTYILDKNLVPSAIQPSSFICAVPARDLGEILSAESFLNKHQDRVRVIRPCPERDIWGVFFKKKR